MKFYDAWGSPLTYPHMAVGWTWAFDTPFRWTKQIASYFGGIRNGMAIAGRDTSTTPGHPQPIPPRHRHRTDDLEVTGIRRRNGQRDHADTHRRREHGLHLRQGQRRCAINAQDPIFEMFGNRGDLSRRVDRLDSALSGAVERYRTDAEGHRERRQIGAVRSIQGLDSKPRRFGRQSREAEGIAGPVLGRGRQIPGPAARCLGVDKIHLASSQHHRRPQRVHYTKPIVGVPLGTAPSILNKSFTIGADVEVPADGGNGMLVTAGGRFGGWGSTSSRGNRYSSMTYWISPGQGSRRALASGARKHQVEFAFKYDGPGLGKGGNGTITVDGGRGRTRSLSPHHTVCP